MLAASSWATATPAPQKNPAEDSDAPAGSELPEVAPVELLVAGLEGEEAASDAYTSLAQFFETASASDQKVTGPLGFSGWLQPEGMGVSDPSQDIRDVEIFLDTGGFGFASKVFEFAATGAAEFFMEPPAADPIDQPQPEVEPEMDPFFQIEYRDGDAVTLFTFNEDTRQAWTTAEDGAEISIPPVLAGYLYAVWEEAGADDEYLVVNASDLFEGVLISDNAILETAMGFEM